VSEFGPPPGPPLSTDRGRRASYLPPGGLAGGTAAGAAGAVGLARYAVTRSARPGIVALRPLGLGDVVDGSVKLARRNPRTVLGVAALANAAAAVPAVLLESASAAGSWMRSSGVAAVVDARSWAMLLGLGGTAYAVLLLAGLLAPAAEEALLGHRPGLGALWAAVRPRVWALAATQLLVLAALVLPWLVLVGGLAAVSRSSVLAVLGTGALLTLAAIAADAVLLPRLLFVAPVQVLDGLAPRAALRRSWALSKGRAWSTGGTFVLATVVAAVVFWVLQLPQWLVYNLLVGLFEPSQTVRDLASSFDFTLASLVSAILVSAFLAGTTVLRYVDARMRAEGYDLVLLRTAASEAQVGR